MAHRLVARRALGAAALAALALGLAFGSAGCVTPKPRAKLEDSSRRAAPIPACVMPLPPRGADAAPRKLTDEQIWKAIFPSFDGQKGLPAQAVACTQRPVFTDPAFRGTAPERAFPLVPADDDMLLGNGGDRLKVVWLRTHKGGSGVSVGPIAVVRGLDRFAEVYGIGVLKAHREGVQLGTERLGGEFVVTAREDTCAERKGTAACEALMHVLLPRRGRLEPVVDVPTQRIEYARGDRTGAFEYQLTATPRFEPDGLHLSEQVVVKDDAGREIRKVEGERTCPLDDRGMVCPEDSLWSRIYPGKR